MVEENNNDTPTEGDKPKSGEGDIHTPKVETPSPPPIPVGDKTSPTPSKADDRISQANAAAARMEEANKKFEELIVRQEAMRVEETLGGKTEAGQPQKLDETPEEYAKKVMANEIETK